MSKKFWPEWTSDDLAHAVTEYQSRDRRFGGLGSGISNEEGK
ncbi:MAG: undecaprenyl diphosphate synthase family protein [Treponema sp.]|nr:undecaprenyl diphosphate synthase family protein [Treponema sp.]